ncbi:MAG TPA: hypothetical protein VFE13_06235 [Caulobacteraceae bacterium]|jgi:hypothetical protein|nr:hypothetical protein [Caulobacteraceae bacterium]
MAEISVGGAVGAGFGLIARQPLAVLVWGLLRVGFLVLVLAIYAPVFLGMFAQIAASAQTGEKPDPAMMNSLMPQMMMVQGFGFLAQIAGLLIGAVSLCAVTRAIIQPERSAFAYLRLGSAELFLAVLAFGAGFVIVFCLMLAIIPFAIAIGILAAMHQAAGAVVVGGLGALILIVGGVYVLARLAFVAPMMVEDNQFHLFDAWTLTKGHVGGIVLTGFLLLLIAIGFGLVLDLLFIGLGAGVLSVAAGGLDHLQTFFSQPPQTIFAALAPSLILLALLIVPIQGCAMAIFYAPWAKAYRDVVPGPPVGVASVTAQPLAPAT